MRIRVLPYKQGSKGAKDLSEALNGRVLKLEGSTFTPQDTDVIINWGSSKLPERLASATVINPPDKVKTATNKLEFFKMMKAAGSDFIPLFWTNKAEIPADAYPVVCRTVLSGHSGEGITIANNPDELVNAPLYVKYVKKKDEYRVHVGSGQIIAVQRKGRRRDVPDEEVNWQVRNHVNGFIYQRQNVSAPASVTGAAIKSLIVSGLDFGAVDVIYHEGRRTSGAKVLEINTAPGLAGSTVNDYARLFRSRGEPKSGYYY